MATFANLVEDLTEAVTGDDSPLAAALAQQLGATLDTEAFSAPTTFVEVDIKVSTHAPTPDRFTVCPPYQALPLPRDADSN